jgi:hypothetical protein
MVASHAGGRRRRERPPPAASARPSHQCDIGHHSAARRGIQAASSHGHGSSKLLSSKASSKPSLHTAQQQPGQEGQRVPNDLASCTHTCQCKRLPCHAPRIRRRRPVPRRQPLPIPPLASPCRPRMPPQPPRTPPLQLLRRRSACHHGRMGGGNATSQPVGQTGVVRRPTTGTAGRGHFD